MVNPQSETNIPIKLDLDNPIFVFYLNMRGITITRVNQILESVTKAFNYSNATFWTIPITDSDGGSSRVELLWKGNNYPNQEETVVMVDSIFKILTSDLTDEEKMSQIREFKLDKLV